MKKYLVKRLVLIIPTLLVISIVAFTLSKMVPQDPALTLLNYRAVNDENPDSEAYKDTYIKLGLDKPNFYFSILPHNYPASLNPIPEHNTKLLLKKLLKLGLNSADAYKLSHSDRADELLRIDNSSLKEKLRSTYDLENIFFPKFHWHGLDNQYHKWMSNFITGDFGNSLINGKAVIDQVLRALLWTFHMAFFDILISFSIGIFIGYRLVLSPKGRKEKWINQLLYILYAVPSFWLATLLVIYFTTDDYGSWTNIFPSVGIDIYPGKSTLQQIWLNIHKLFLPIMISFFSSVAYLVRILRRSLLDQMDSAYIMTAYSKGLTKKDVVRKHALPNSLIPIITLFAGAVPATIGSSVVIEVIFNIPGIGRLLFTSIQLADWNVVFCILLLIGLITSLSYLFADLLYALFNPKIRFA